MSKRCGQQQHILEEGKRLFSEENARFSIPKF